MALNRTTFVKQTQIWSDSGFLSASIYMQKTLRCGRTIVKVHRMSIAPDDDVETVLAVNNTHLASAGYPPIDLAEFSLVLSIRSAVLDAPASRDVESVNPVHSIEINSGGGMRLSVKSIDPDGDGDEDEDCCEKITVGPFDDAADVISKHNEKLGAEGYITLAPEHLTKAMTIRGAAHKHPIVKERMKLEWEMLEAERIQKEARQRAVEEERAAEEERQRLETEERQRQEHLEAEERRQQDIERERLAAEERRRQDIESERVRVEAEEERLRKLIQEERIRWEDEQKTESAIPRGRKH